MSEELERLVEETVSNMKQMDRESLLLMKSNSEVLKVRDSMDKKDSEKGAWWESDMDAEGKRTEGQRNKDKQRHIHLREVM